jgi:hypothetical protein
MYNKNDEPKQQPGMQQIVRIEDDLATGDRKMTRQVWVESRERNANRDLDRFVERLFQLPDNGVTIIADGLMWTTVSGMTIQGFVWGFWSGMWLAVPPFVVVLLLLSVLSGVAVLFAAAENVLPSKAVLFYRAMLIIIGLLLGAF